VEELSHELRRIRWMLLIPTFSKDQIIRSNQLEMSICSWFVNYDLRLCGIDYTAIYQGAIHVVKTHRATVRPAHATEHKRVSLVFGHGDVLKALRGLTDDLD